MLPGSAVPSITPLVISLVVISGASGALVSTVKLTVVDSSDVLPAASVADAVKLNSPSAKAVAGVNVQLPSPSAVAVPIELPSRKTSTVLPGSAVPSITPLVISLVVISGASGALVSTVKLTVVDSSDVLPAASVADAVKLNSPSAKAVAGVNVQLPESSAVAVPIELPSRNISTVLPGSAVPVISGVVSLVAPVVVIVGASGAVVSTVKLTGVDSSDVLPAASVADAVKLNSPCAKAVAGVNVQFPESSAVAVPRLVPSRNISTVLPGSAVPVISGVVSLVAPVVVIVGASGAMPSTNMAVVSPTSLSVKTALMPLLLTMVAPSATISSSPTSIPSKSSSPSATV
ncbi:hypothetical protein NIES46_50140 [Arthrospira platensis NIES-46]|uniref:Uncharacterized protein n=1 Tax=Limnospira platensis NIES-46 TaxID=1236695 RepID=A0A5M3TGU8_LIMPL|nr:hypothetical protein NIES46_50140 [Arthrospira platensis NIES-46]